MRFVDFQLIHGALKLCVMNSREIEAGHMSRLYRRKNCVKFVHFFSKSFICKMQSVVYGLNITIYGTVV